MTNRGSLVIVLLLGLAVAACQQQPTAPGTDSTAVTEASLTAWSEIATDLILSIEIPSATLVAGTEVAATVAITNDSTATVEISDRGPGIWISDSAGVAVVSPRRIRHPLALAPLEPGQSRSEDVTFTVPPPGTYFIQAEWQVAATLLDDGRTTPLQFTSVQP